MEHTCGLVFLFPGKYYLNVKCFERIISNDDQPFRGRARVIKALPGNRRSRSSRTDSFTDSLLLRQRSQSTPLAQFSYSILFDVKEDPDTVVDGMDTGYYRRVSCKDLPTGGKQISMSGTTSGVSGKESSLSELQTAEKHASVSATITIGKDSPVITIGKDSPVITIGSGKDSSAITIGSGKDSSVLEKGSSVSKKYVGQNDDLKNEECGEIGTKISGRSKETALEEDVLPSVVNMDKTEADSVVNMDKTEADGFNLLNDKSDSQPTNEVSLERNDIALTEETLGENLLSQDSTNEEQDLATANSSHCSDESEIRNATSDKDEHDLCQGLTIQEIELNFKENESRQDEHASERPEAGAQPKVEENVRTETSSEEITQEVNVEKTNTSSGEECEDTGVRSPSVKDRITFFNSS